jgi:hypothetical protein
MIDSGFGDIKGATSSVQVRSGSEIGLHRYDCGSSCADQESYEEKRRHEDDALVASQT